MIRPALLLCASAAFLALCGVASAEEGPTKKMKRPDVPPAEFTAGPPIAPVAGLLEWLKAEVVPARPRRLIRLPVVMMFKKERFMGLEAAFVGTTVGAPPEGALKLTLDDSGMGIALSERLQMRCPPPQRGCALWLEGYWGALVGLEMPGSQKPSPEHTLSVFRVVGPVQHTPEDPPPRAEAQRQ